MKKIADFFKSILPILLMLVLQVVVTFIMGIVCVLTSDASFAEVMNGIFSTGAIAYPWLTNVVYGITAVLIFGLWYRSVFTAPFKNEKKKAGDRPRGFAFRLIISVLFLGIGLYYVTALVVDAAAAVRPEWLENYNSMMQGAGYTDPTLLMILYVVILAPVSEELIFRGLTMRYARRALPFWIADIWQALLFGLMHFNILQGLYAFAMGLFLGYVAHRGKGIRYSVAVHILFNIVGLFFSELVGATLDASYPLAMLVGIALTAFALWFFSTAFPTRHTTPP